MIDVPYSPAPLSIDLVENLVACSERRLRRAAERLERAQDELVAAQAALARARDERAAWIVNNPDPQIMLL